MPCRMREYAPCSVAAAGDDMELGDDDEKEGEGEEDGDGEGDDDDGEQDAVDGDDGFAGGF